MSKFSLRRKMPTCLVTRDLLSALEEYLNVDMHKRLGSALGDEVTYRISIREKIGTETLASINEFSPSMFSDGTKEIEIRWENGAQTKCQLEITIDFDGDYYASSVLTVECGAATARETAIGVADAIFRLLEPHQTYNWFFNPTQQPIVSMAALLVSMVLLFNGLLLFGNTRQRILYMLAALVLSSWIFLSSAFFRRRIMFNTRRQQTLDRLWRYISLGTLGFLLFGTLFPLIRKVLLGF